MLVSLRTPHLVLQIPHAVLVGELLVAGAALRQNAALKATHVEEQVGVVFAVDGHKAVLPLDRGDRSGQAVLDVPENGSSTGEEQKALDECWPVVF